MKKKLIYFLFLASFLPSCESKSLDPVDKLLGYDYFPVEVGYFISYNVKESIYKVNQPVEQKSYQLKEVFSEKFADQSGAQIYKIVRYQRENGRKNWQIVSELTASKSRLNAVRNEFNFSFIKLVFPLEKDKTWNGNVLNNLGTERYVMQDLAKEFTFSGKKYSKTVTVIENNDSTLVNKDVRKSVYSEQIGLIYSKSEQLAYCQDQKKGCLGKAIIESGRILEMSIFDSGKE
ncbi:MAG: hypothetical protein EAZ97_15455 [Bacteroidetes bacterium]|nr:MAG: hypothetical protein EAZ97_15455 [Bacteroidota bacterium]